MAAGAPWLRSAAGWNLGRGGVWDAGSSLGQEETAPLSTIPLSFPSAD